MAETLVAPTATEAAPAAAEPQAAPTTELTGIQAAMAEFGEQTTPKPKEAAPAKTDKAADPAKAEPAKADPAKVVAPKEPAKKVDIWEKADGKLKGEHFKTVRQFEEKISGYEKRIKEIESKPVETKADTKLVEDLQKRVADYEKRVAALDFRSSEAFKKEYSDRINAEYADHLEEIKSLQIYSKDQDGNETSRPATKDDYDRLFQLPPAERDKAIAAFGTSAYTVAGMFRNLVSMSKASERAIAEHAAKAELTAKEQSIAKDREQGDYQKHYDSSNAELQKTYPQYFAPDENDPEATTALEGGYKFVDDVLSKVEAMNVSDRAAYNAVLRARAAGFPRAVLDNNRLRAQVESLNEELKKFRKSDPGSSEGDKGGAAPSGADEIPTGIDAAASDPGFKI